MRRRINNLHKGMFKGNKTSNIIELHSRKKPQDKSKDNQIIKMSQYKYENNDENNGKDINKKNIYKNNEQRRNNSPNKKEKVTNLYNNTFSDSDSSHNKSMIKTKLYNKYAKSGTYFKRLRQQVIDKFISGKPLISIERMYNNPEVKKMFGIQNNTEKANYQSNNSYKDNEEESMPKEEERDRRIPPSKFISIPNIYNNNINMLYNGDCYNNFNNRGGVEDTEEINPNNFNIMNKLNPIYYRDINYYNPDKNNINDYQNNNKFIPKLKIFNNLNNNVRYTNNNINEINNINNNNKTDIIEFDMIQDLNNDFRRKRISNNERRNDYMIQFDGINEEINNEYNNKNREFNEVEDINNLLNNLKNANNNNYNIFPYNSKDNDSYFNKLLIKKDKETNFINYFKNQKNIIETSEQINEISFNTPSKK